MDDQELQALYASQSRNRKNYQASQEKKAALNDRIEKNGSRSFARTERMALEHAILEKQSKQAVFDYIVNDALLMTVSDELTDEQMAPFDELNEEFAEEINKNSPSTPPPPPVPPMVPPLPTPIVQSYVASGAKMMCPFAMGGTSALVVTPGRRTSMQGPPKANIMDNKPLVNIPTFGVCSSMANPQVAAATAAAMGVLTPQPCIPNIVAPWTPGKANLLVEGQPALLNTDTLQCAWGGVITLMPDPTTHTGSAPQASAPKTPKATSCIVLMTTVCPSNDGETNTCVVTDNNRADSGISDFVLKKIHDIPKDILKDNLISGAELLTERIFYREWMEEKKFFKKNRDFAKWFDSLPIFQSKLFQNIDKVKGVLDFSFVKEPLERRIAANLAPEEYVLEQIRDIDQVILDKEKKAAEQLIKKNDAALDNLLKAQSAAETEFDDAFKQISNTYDEKIKQAKTAAENERKRIKSLIEDIGKAEGPEWKGDWYYDQFKDERMDKKLNETIATKRKAASEESIKELEEARRKRQIADKKALEDYDKAMKEAREEYEKTLDNDYKKQNELKDELRKKRQNTIKESKELNNTVGKGIDKSEKVEPVKNNKNASNNAGKKVEGKSEKVEPVKNNKNASNNVGKKVTGKSRREVPRPSWMKKVVEGLKKAPGVAVNLAKKTPGVTANVAKNVIVRTATNKGKTITVKTALGKAGGAVAGFAIDAVFYLMEDKSDYAQSFDQAYEKRKQAEREGRASTIGQKMRLFADDIGGTYHDMGKDSILPWETVGDYANYTIRGYAELSMASEEFADEIYNSPQTMAEVIDNYDPKKANYKKYLSRDFHKELNEDGKVAGNLIGAFVTEKTGWKGLGDFVNAAVRLGPGVVYVGTEVVKEVAPSMAVVGPAAMAIKAIHKKFF